MSIMSANQVEASLMEASLTGAQCDGVFWEKYDVYTALFLSGLYATEAFLGAGGEQKTDICHISTQAYLNV